MNYFDAGVFLYALLNRSEKGEYAIGLLDELVRGKIAACTASLTYDEVVWKTRLERGIEASREAGKTFLTLRNIEIISVDNLILNRTQELIERYSIKPRDAIHAATSIQQKADYLYSEDTDFDKIKEIKRKWI